MDELRAQGGVQAVLEAHDKAQQYYADLQVQKSSINGRMRAPVRGRADNSTAAK